MIGEANMYDTLFAYIQSFNTKPVTAAEKDRLPFVGAFPLRADSPASPSTSSLAAYTCPCRRSPFRMQ